MTQKLISPDKVIVIFGPTTTGKTALALELAQKYNSELISADSRQVYKSLDIGSGKVSFESRVAKHDGFWIVDGIRINGFDLVNPGKRFTAVDFLKHTNNSIIRIIEQNKIPIIVGGTGFYIKALISGLDTMGIPSNEKLRNRLKKLRAIDLYKKLLRLDPKRTESMNRSDSQNPRRLIRAIEIAQSLLTPGVRTEAIWHTPGVFKVIGLTASNNYLYQKSGNWLNERLKRGLIEEVDSLIKKGISPAWLESLGLEYRWITKYLMGNIPKEEAIERLIGDTHGFIRRQKTWFKQFANIEMIDVESKDYTQKVKKIFANFNRTDIY